MINQKRLAPIPWSWATCSSLPNHPVGMFAYLLFHVIKLFTVILCLHDETMQVQVGLSTTIQQRLNHMFKRTGNIYSTLHMYYSIVIHFF